MFTKLYSYSFDYQIVNFSKSYLDGRSQYLFFKGKLSKVLYVRYGVCVSVSQGLHFKPSSVYLVLPQQSGPKSYINANSIHQIAELYCQK